MRSCNHCFSSKVISITCSDYVFVALGIQHVTRIRHIFICGLSGCTIILTASHKRHDLRKKLLNLKCVLIFSTKFCLRHFSFWGRGERERNQLDITINVHIFPWSTRYSRQIFKKLEFSGQIFEKYSNVNSNENLSIGSRVQWWQTDGRTDGHDEANSGFLQFCEHAQIVYIIPVRSCLLEILDHSPLYIRKERVTFVQT